MAVEFDKAAEIAKIALQYRKLLSEGAMWSGGPVNKETLQLVAGQVAQSLDAESMLRGMEESEDLEKSLRQLLAILWAQGFNVGAMYTDKQREN